MSASKRPTIRRIVTYLAGGAALALARPGWAVLAAGSVLALAGAALRVWATGYLIKNDRLTRAGPYRFVRHPLYLGTWLIATGILVACIGPDAPVLWLVALLALFQVAFFGYYLPRKERKEAGRLERRFGEAFVDFRREVPGFVPRLTPAPLARLDRAAWSFQQVGRNTEWAWSTVTVLALAFLAVRSAGWI